MTEVELIEKAAIKVGMMSMLNYGAASCVYSEGCDGVSQEHLIAFAREVALHCVAALQPSAGAEPAFYVRDSDVEALADRRIAGRGAMLHKDAGEGRTAYFAHPPVTAAREQEADALQWKFECFIDFATGGRLSKSSWALETLKAAVTEYINAEIIMHTEQEASATGAEKVYLVCTGEVYEGRETYTRHDRAPQMCDFETLYATPTTSTTGKVDASRVRDGALEEAAQLAEQMTMRQRLMRAAGDAKPVQPCEIAAAIRSIGTPKSGEGA
jgi:hypothetical protein